MNLTNPTPQASRPAAEFCADAMLTAEGRALLDDRITARDFLERLAAGALYPDALRFMACCLPKEQAIWWGCLCVWETCRPEPPPKVAAALQAVVRWLCQPDETNRRAAERAGKAAGNTATPAGALALAVFWSQGSMSLPGLPEVLPPATLTVNTIGEAVVLAAVQSPPQEIVQQQQLFLQFGMDVALGKNVKP